MVIGVLLSMRLHLHALRFAIKDSSDYNFRLITAPQKIWDVVLIKTGNGILSLLTM